MPNYMFDVIEHIRENLPRLEDVFVSEGSETQEAYSDEEIMNHAFWLNDLLFICPPQSINTQTDQLVAKYQAMRSSASSKVPYGKGTKYFMVDLVIPAKSAIMNVDYRLPDNNAVATVSNEDDYVNTGKRGGILDLIIQFKVTPFARVENAFIRSTLGISKDKNMAMCLHQLTLYTIKGRKGAVGCKLLMSVFNYSPYSPNFLYKEDWVTKNKYGRFNIESVNRIDFGDAAVTARRIPYKVYVQGVTDAIENLGFGERLEREQSPEVEAQESVSPLVQRTEPVSRGEFVGSNLSNEERSRAFEEQYNMLFTENEDEMSSVDSYFMEAPRAVMNPATSAVFKAYIDWVHSQWTSIKDLDGEFNGGAISQYGSEEQDLGDQVILEWKEFKTEPMPPEVEQEVKIWYRQRMADYQTAKETRDNYEIYFQRRNTQSDSSTDSSLDSAPRGGTADQRLLPSSEFINNSNLSKMANLIEELILRRRGSLPDGSEWGIDLQFDPNLIASEIIASSNNLGVPVILILIGCLSNNFNPWARNRRSTAHGMADQLASIARIYMDRNYRQPRENMIPYLEPGRAYNSLTSEEADEIIQVMYNDPAQQIRSMARHIAKIISYPRNNSRWRVLEGQIAEGQSQPIRVLDEVMASYAYGSGDRLESGIRYLNRRFYSRFEYIVNTGKDIGLEDFINELLDQYNYIDANLPEPTNSEYNLENSNSEEETNNQNEPPRVDQVERERRQAENYNEEALASLDKYRQFVEAQESQGWRLYKKNTLAYNIFYKVKRISIPASDQENYPLGVPIVCDFISGGASNIIATIPMMGQAYPTAQYLGRRDDEFMLSFRAVGLNNVKLLSRIRDELKTQAHSYKWIPDAWMIKVENKFINAFGHRYFVINNMSEVTSPGQPNTYNIEIGITSHPANTDQSSITSMQVTNTEEIKLTFWEELLYGYAEGEDVNRKLLKEKNVTWKLVYDDLSSGTSIKPYLRGEDEVNWLTLPNRQRMAFVANPEILSRIQNAEQPGSSPGDPSSSFRDPNQDLFNFLNITVASTLNLIRLIKFTDRNLVYKYQSLHDRIIAIDFEWLDPHDMLPLGAGNIVAETSLAFERENRPVLGSSRQRSMIQYANQTGEFDNWFIERQGFTRWSSPEKTWSFADNVARLEDLVLLDSELLTTRNEGAIGGILAEAYNYSANVHIENFINGQYRPGAPVPIMDAYLDVSPAIKAWFFAMQIQREIFINTFDYLDRNKVGGSKASTIEYFCSLFTRELRAGFLYPVFFPPETVDGVGLVSAYQGQLRLARPIPLGGPEGGGYAVPFQVVEPRSGDIIGVMTPGSFEPSFREAILVPMDSRNVFDRILRSGLIDETSSLNPNRWSYGALIVTYIWDQLAIPYLNNAFSMEEIIRYSEFTWLDGTPMFPRTLELLRRQKIGAEGVAYPDMMLPLHPFWSSQNSTLPVSSIYTEPDFYLVNYGIDTNIESAHLEPINNGTVRTSENATNHFIQLQSELAVQSLDMMEGRARDENNNLISEVQHTTIDGVTVPKSKAFIEMVNPVNPNALGTFKGDSVYLRSDHSMGSYYASGDIDPNTGSRTKNYSEAVRTEALQSGAPNITKTQSADPSSDTIIGQKINQSPLDTRLNEEALSYFQGTNSTETFSYQNNPQGSDVQLNAGMRVLQDRESQNPDQVLWRNVVSLFGPNTAFPETPLSFGGQSFVGMGFDGYSRHSPASIIQSINNDNDSVYLFNSESASSDPSAFVNGNWGYSDIHQFTTSRLSTYEKIRDGLKGLNLKKWAFRRAFPTFKVYIIEEDQIEREWVQYDDFYQYNQIQEIQISESRKRPASVCMINFINIGGALDGNNQWHYWARSNPAEEYDSFNPNRARQNARRERMLTSDTSNPLLAGTAEEQNINRFVLNPGVKIKVKLGYSNNPTKMEDVFLGSIAEIVPDADAGSVVIIAQSYGAELVEKPKGASKEEIATTYFTTFDVLASLMFSSEVKHFGKKKINSMSMIGMDQSLAQNELIYRNTVSQTTSNIVRRTFGTLLRVIGGAVTLGTSEAIIATVGLANDLSFEIDRQLTQIRVGPEDGPQDDNIYAPNYSKAELNYHWWNPRNITNGRWRVGAPASAGVETLPLQMDAEDLPPGSPVPGWAVPVASNPWVPPSGLFPIADPNFQYYEQMSPSELEYNIFYSSIWDVFQEMTLRHPGFVKHPRIYKNSNRMTMFFGLPDQKYWASEPSVGEITQANATFSAMRDGVQMVQATGPTINRRSAGITDVNPGGYRTALNGYGNRTSRSTSEGNAPGELAVDIDLLSNWMSLVQRRLKPFRNWYSINSATDIIENRIEANKLGFYTSVSLQYLSGASAKKLKGALRRLERAGGADSELITPSNFIAWSDREVEHTQAHRDMSPDEIRQKFHQFANCRSRSMARRYSRALLASYAKEMYKGTISMIGNSKIKPYDVLLINDTHHNVQGPIEVEEVIHNFNPMTGFTTEVIPDTFIIQEDRTAFVVWNSLWAHAALKTSRHMEGILFQRDNTLPDSNAFNILADRYRRNIEFERENIARLNELVTDLREREVPGGLAIGGIGAVSLVAGIAAGSTGVGLIGLGAAALGVGIWRGLISNFFTSLYVNYVHNNRAYFMIPLMRNNSPWTVGYNITGTNSFAMGVFDLIRRWWQDGGEGVTLSNIDAALTEQRIGLSLSSQLNTFSRLSLGWDDFTRSFRTGLTLGGSINIQSGIR